jgi:hypothetical protein
MPVKNTAKVTEKIIQSIIYCFSSRIFIGAAQISALTYEQEPHPCTSSVVAGQGAAGHTRT